MGFPTSLGEVKTQQEVWDAEEKRLNEEVEAAQAALSAVENRREAHQGFAAVVQRLLSSWKDADPGKYGSAYFFVGKWNDAWVVVREFLPKGTIICTSQEEWRRYADSRSWWGSPYDKVRPSLPVVSLAEVKTESCPNCNEACPVVEHYVQTYDSAEGDNWLTERRVLCLDCKGAFLVSEPRNSDLRTR